MSDESCHQIGSLDGDERSLRATRCQPTTGSLSDVFQQAGSLRSFRFCVEQRMNQMEEENTGGRTQRQEA